MGRFIAGVASALLLTAAGIFWWSGSRAESPVPPAPLLAAPAPADPLAPPPQASEQTREERRFARYDRDRNGAVARDEYLAARRKAFARLDRDGDGRLSFEEYAVKTSEKFARADGDRSGALDAREFATTRIVRKTPAKPDCPPPPPGRDEAEEG
ncbi:EF hand [Sphingomonas laterariae]|uniref:EF hand n=1 Tax=Edaphosphingomonas laterariae TaxID=861865 RepID=A0A239HMB1_9SPHN|nr:histidine kinase [Sphingomonas laterariae]SNS82480.1 EF hand [Sphingomonas laterariae]